MRKIFFLFCLLIIISFKPALSQNLVYVRGIIDTLCMPDFYGRGYVNSGEKIAADYIAKQLTKLNILHFNDTYFQPLSIAINTLPGTVELKINQKTLQPGIDYVVNADASPINFVTNSCYLLNEKTLNKPRLQKKFYHTDFSQSVIFIDTGFHDMTQKKLQEAGALIKISDKNISWHVAWAQKPEKQIKINISRKSLPKKVKEISMKIESKHYESYQTQNVIGYLPGTLYPDSFIVVGAHYDHLGMMGDQTYFPGANDNASGTAMVLDLAAYFSDTNHRSDYSLAFMFFTAEEVGLFGSEYYTQNPLFPLGKIKFMLNLDMVGTGSEGIKVVNGSVLTEDFEKLKQLNEASKYLKTISPRGEAANSDHYYFYKNGVKSFFVYTLGNEYKEYHTVTDKSSGLPLTKYTELFRLMVDFINSF